MNYPRFVLVTGASSGIGLATCHKLQDQGFRVIPTARTTADLERLANLFGSSIYMDMCDGDSITKGFARALELAGDHGIYGLFANAGFGLLGGCEDIPREALTRQLETNVIGPHQIIALAVRHMLVHGGGRILVNSSVLGLVAQPMRSAYCASKFALEGLCDSLRLELIGTPVHVSLIEPGPVLTRFRANALAAFDQHIGTAGAQSRHAARYAGLRKKLGSAGPVVPFTATADHCATQALRAFTASCPKRRYPVTVQTRVLGPLRRLLPTSLLDLVASRF